jgi:excisionase family DNA binding protein
MTLTDRLRALPAPEGDAPSPWLLPSEAAQYARVSLQTLYREARLKRLQHARVGGRRELRFRREYLDNWLQRWAVPVEQS